MRALAAFLIAVALAGSAAAQEGCPTAETARSKGYTLRMDNGIVLVVAPGATSEIVAYEERRPQPGGAGFVSQIVSHAGILSLSIDNEQARTVFTFDKPVESLVPKAVGESVEFAFQAHVEPKGGERRTRDGTQRHSVIGAEQIIVGRCSYRAQVFLKSGRFPAENESYEQRLLYVPELRLPLLWRIERKVGGKTDTFQMRAAGIEEGS